MPAAPDRIAAERQFLVSVEGVPGYFARHEGRETAADTSREFDGGSLDPEVMAGPATPGNITISRPWRPSRDAEIARELERVCGRSWRTVTIQPTDPDLVKVGRPFISQALLVRVRFPNSDANSGTAARLELEFAVQRNA